MALVKCPECGKDISDKAKVCPLCGYPLTRGDVNSSYEEILPKLNSIVRGIKKYIVAVIILLCLICTAIILFFSNRRPEGISKPVYDAAVRYVSAAEKYLEGEEFEFSDEDRDLLNEAFDGNSGEKYIEKESLVGELFFNAEVERFSFIVGRSSETDYKSRINELKKVLELD